MRRRLRALLAAAEEPAGAASPASSWRTRSAAGAPTRARVLCSEYREALRVRNIDSQADSIGLGLRAAVDTAAEAATLRGAAATTGKKPACGPRRVEDFIDGAATERRGRTPAGRGTFERDYEPVRRLLMFDGEAPGAVASLDESPAGGAADEDPRRQRCGGVRLVLSLRLDDTDSNVLCDLRLASSVDVLADALADLSVADDARRGSSSVAYDAAASDAGWSLIARMEHLRIRPLTPAAQKLSYVGYWALLLEHMASRGMRTITPAAVRAWLLREAGDLVARLVEAHGAPFPDLQVDHIVAHKWGGVDHPYNYFIMHRSANTSFNSDVTREKVEHFMGRDVAKVVKGFCDWARNASAVNYGDFQQHMMMHMR